MTRCTLPPPEWWCSLLEGHEGSCPTHPCNQSHDCKDPHTWVCGPTAGAEFDLCQQWEAAPPVPAPVVPTVGLDVLLTEVLGPSRCDPNGDPRGHMVTMAGWPNHAFVVCGEGCRAAGRAAGHAPRLAHDHPYQEVPMCHMAGGPATVETWRRGVDQLRIAASGVLDKASVRALRDSLTQWLGEVVEQPPAEPGVYLADEDREELITFAQDAARDAIMIQLGVLDRRRR